MTFHLKQMLSEARWSVADLVRNSGVNRNTLYAINNNCITRVDLSVLQRICDALQRPLSDLVEYAPAVTVGRTAPPITAAGPDHATASVEPVNDSASVPFTPEYKRPREGIIFVISGPSGAGKNTLINLLKPLQLGVHYIPSFTTREMRLGEYQGNPYYFVDPALFQQMVDGGEFLEYETIHGNLYGTHAKTYENAIEHGFDAIKDIDVKGALNFKQRFPGHVVLIYVRPSNLTDLVDRLCIRGDKATDIEVRMNRIQFEESKREQFDYVVYNDDAEQAKLELVRIVQQRS